MDKIAVVPPASPSHRLLCVLRSRSCTRSASALNNLQAQAGNDLVPGAKVTLKGLVADASLNGQTFEVMAVDKEKAVVKVGDENVGVEPANFDLVQETSGKSEPAKPEEAKPEEAKQQPAPTASFATANELAKTRVDQETAPPTTHYAEGTHVVLEVCLFSTNS